MKTHKNAGIFFPTAFYGNCRNTYPAKRCIFRVRRKKSHGERSRGRGAIISGAMPKSGKNTRAEKRSAICARNIIYPMTRSEKSSIRKALLFGAGCRTAHLQKAENCTKPAVIFPPFSCKFHLDPDTMSHDILTSKTGTTHPNRKTVPENRQLFLRTRHYITGTFSEESLSDFCKTSPMGSAKIITYQEIKTNFHNRDQVFVSDSV